MEKMITHKHVHAKTRNPTLALSILNFGDLIHFKTFIITTNTV